MAANRTLIGEQGYDRAEEVKQFDESKLGVKGLVDSGLSSIPRIFIHPPEILQQFQPTTRPNAQPIPTIDLSDLHSDRRSSIVDQVSGACRNFGFFQITNHGIPSVVLDRTIAAVKAFHEQPTEVKARFYRRETIGQGVAYFSDVDLYTSKAASWRDTLQVGLNVKGLGNLYGRHLIFKPIYIDLDPCSNNHTSTQVLCPIREIAFIRLFRGEDQACLIQVGLNVKGLGNLYGRHLIFKPIYIDLDPCSNNHTSTQVLCPIREIAFIRLFRGEDQACLIQLGPLLEAADDVPKICRDEIVGWDREIRRLGDELLGLVSEGLGLRAEKLKEMTCLGGRAMVGHYYPPCPQPDLTVGLTSHRPSLGLLCCEKKHF